MRKLAHDPYLPWGITVMFFSTFALLFAVPYVLRLKRLSGNLVNRCKSTENLQIVPIDRTKVVLTLENNIRSWSTVPHPPRGKTVTLFQLITISSRIWGEIEWLVRKFCRCCFEVVSGETDSSRIFFCLLRISVWIPRVLSLLVFFKAVWNLN